MLRDVNKNVIRKEKTEAEFKKYITRVACSLFALGILGLFVVRSNSLSDYALGLVLGFTIWGLCPCQSIILLHLPIPKRLHRMYIGPMMSEINRF